MRGQWIAVLLLAVSAALAVEGDAYRLLSVSSTGKLILVSEPSTKNKLLLDAAAAKLTLDGKPTEFKNLLEYSIIHVKFDAKKSDREGIAIDGIATEIRILSPENVPSK
jgi:hypothetical protein